MFSIEEINNLENDLTQTRLENKKLQEILEITSKQYNSLLKKYNEVIKLARENADVKNKMEKVDE